MAGFYDERQENAFLLGDVVIGFQAIVPCIHRPDQADAELGITVTRPSYFAVMTPCCSVGDRRISLSPLVHIKGDFLKNPYFAEDLTRINTPGPPEKITPPERWARMSFEQKQLANEEPLVYGVNEAFIYAEDDRLARYPLRIASKGRSEMTETGFYMLEFGSAFRLNCDQVVRDKPAPVGVKLLQLSVGVRQNLRDKLKNYFGRTPLEDKRLLELQ